MIIMEDKMTYNKGECIFQEGAAENWMFLILSGSVGIYADYPANPRLLTTLVRRDIFGEMGMIEETLRSASAVALTDVSLQRIDKDNFETALTENPKLIQVLMGCISNRIAVLSKDYVDVCGVVSEYVKAKEAGTPTDKKLINKMKTILDNHKGNRK